MKDYAAFLVCVQGVGNSVKLVQYSELLMRWVIKLKQYILLFTTNKKDMGRVRTKTVKRAAKVLLEKHYQKLTSDFHINKRILSEVAKVPTKRLRNKIAGFATHLVKRIQKGPVKGISLKVQEEERERRLDWVPKESEVKLDKVAIDAQTQNMLRSRYGEDVLNKLVSNLEVKAAEVQKKDNRAPKRKGDRKERPQRPQKEKAEGTQEGTETQEPKQKREPREPREAREPREPRAPREPKEGKQVKREERKKGNREGQ